MDGDLIPADNPGAVSGVTLIGGEPAELVDAHWLFANHLGATVKPAAHSVCRLPADDPWMQNMDPFWTDAGFLLALERFGYDVTESQKAVIAFQRRFRPDRIDGIIDGECRAKLLALLLPRPQ